MRKLLYCLTLLLCCCKEKYEPPVNAPANGYIVVEGYISANGPAEIHLSRSIALSDTAKQVNETLARLQLQGRDNSVIHFTETPNGLYRITQLNLNPSQQYRLYFRTKDGKEYASDYVKVKNAPQIDSIGWARTNGGVTIYANSHDPDNKTWYYRWTTEETWQFQSSYYTNLEFLRNANHSIIGVKYRKPDMSYATELYTCWQNENSTKLLLGSSAKLSKDSIHKDLTYIQPGSWKMGILYSILVKQYALDKEEYEYLEKMRKNSEATGDFFGPMPSELKGNIHNLGNIAEPVIGYIGIADRREKRIWIRRTDLPDWRYFMECVTYEVAVDSANYYQSLMPTVPLSWDRSGLNIATYLGVSPVCVDCTLRGINVKPSFWP